MAHPPRPSPQPPPAHSLYTGAERDPFLAQSRDIALTERDRQEGYDVELLNARPRGSSQEKRGAGEYGAGYTGGKEGWSGAATGEGTGSLRQGPARRRTSTSLGAAAGEGGKKRWYLRPLALLLIGGVLGAIALAIGLGVGLSQAHKNNAAASSSNNDSSSTSNSTRTDSVSSSSPSARDSRDSRTEDSSATSSAEGASATAPSTRNATASIFTATDDMPTSTGTVIPSSLYTSISSEDLYNASSFISSFTSSNSTDLPSITSSNIPIPASGTTLASTGNLPIPANSATTVGTEVVSVISALGGTAKVRRRGEREGLERARR